MTISVKGFPFSQCASDAINNKSVTVYSRSHDAVIRVYDDAGNVIARHEHTGWFKAFRGFAAGSVAKTSPPSTAL